MHTRSARHAGLAGCLVLAAASAFPAPPQKPSPRRDTAAAPITIVHKDVGCVLAGRFPRLEACFTPAEAVARARVEFRSDERSVWYAVDMTRDGSCYSALLPKPTTSIERFQYFVEAIDRSFLTAYDPDQAPGGAYAPRVVAKAAECGQGRVVGATSQPTGSLLVSVSRDASGKVLQAVGQAAGQAAGTPASISGFSMDGVTMPGAPGASAPSTGASTGSAGTTAGAAGATAGAAGTGIGLTTLAIAGGAVAAGAVVAVAASGGGDGGSGPGADAGLTGHWTGTSANGGGLTEVVTVEGASCTWVWDLTLDLVQSGTSLSGTIGVTVLRSFACSFPFPTPVPAGGGGSVPLNGTVNGDRVTFQASDITFTGTRSGSRLSGTAASAPEPGSTITFTWSVSR